MAEAERAQARRHVVRLGREDPGDTESVRPR